MASSLYYRCLAIFQEGSPRPVGRFHVSLGTLYFSNDKWLMGPPIAHRTRSSISLVAAHRETLIAVVVNAGGRFP